MSEVLTQRNMLSAIPKHICAVAIVSLSGLLLAAKEPPLQSAPATSSPANNGATYMGMEACRTCHEDVVKNFEKTNAHAILDKDKRHGFEGKTCEACHGPGSKHVETASPDDIIRPAHLMAPKADAVCLSCHLHQETQVGRIENGHAHSQVTCITCHTIHGTREDLVARKPAAINRLCANCHSNEWSQFFRPYAHRLTQGAMSCVDCHNPHGNFLPGNRQMFAANEPGCFRCHAEYRGPFPFEHAVVKTEGCTACHMPHGSSNPKLLTRHLVRLVCLECHANMNPTGAAITSRPRNIGGVPPSFHNISNPLFQNCTICHTKVHGSYVDRFLER